MNTDFPKDKYGYEVPRCHYVNLTNGDTCNAPPMTGEHYCFFHHPEQQAKREEASRNGGRNRRQPEPQPLIPPNLPRISLKTRADLAALYEETINHVRQGQMGLNVASTIGYLAMGLLCTLEADDRAEHRAAQAAEKAAETAQPRNSSGRKPPYKPMELEITDYKGNIIYSTSKPPSAIIEHDQPGVPNAGVPNDGVPNFSLLHARPSASGKGLSAPLSPEPKPKEACKELPNPSPNRSNVEAKQDKRDKYTPTESGPPEIRTF